MRRLTVLLLVCLLCIANAALKRAGKESTAISNGVQSEKSKAKSIGGRSTNKKAVKTSAREQIVEKAVRPVAGTKAAPSSKSINERSTNKVSHYYNL